MTLSPLGFIGLGNMGGPMAGRLIDAGYELVVFDTNAPALDALADKGAVAAGSVAEIAARTATVLVSLPTPDVVRAVALGPEGLAAGGMVRHVVDLSTTGPQAEAEIGADLAAAGITLIDCPVSGGMAGARQGTLALMASGERAVYDLLAPALEHLGKLFYVGERPGLAQTMKLVNNICSLTAIAITAEAMALGAKGGLDADTMIEVLNASSGRNSATLDKFPRFVLSGSFDFGFSTALSAKDTKLCLEEGERLGVPMPVASAARQMLAVTRSQFGPDADMTTIARTLEQWAGVEIRGKAARDG